MDLLIQLTDFLAPYGTQSYIVMFVVLLACGFGLPLPEDVVLVSGGILAARGVCEVEVVHLVCFAGVLIGDGVMFYLGRSLGPAIKNSVLFRRLMTESVDRRVSYVFSRYGDKVVFMGRFMPGLRAPIFMSSGIYRVSPWKFFALDGFAALISVPVWIWLGYVFGANLEELERWMGNVQIGLYVALAVVLAGLVFWIRKKKSGASTSSPSI